ncbi:MAG: hypothetical protein HY537_17110 [Deltaproteobacteria bacterium]|nr:hypothetical protein [Deltaproteobacteria bacterium]
MNKFLCVGALFLHILTVYLYAEDQAMRIDLGEVAYMQAMLTEVDSLGHETGNSIKTLTLFRNARSEKPVSLEFTEAFLPPPCKGEICPMIASVMRIRNFRIINISADQCGSVRYVAAEKLPNMKASAPVMNRPAKLFLTDHSDRTCKDWRKYHTWEVRLVDYLPKGPVKVRNFFGEPEYVFNVEACLEEVYQTACSTLYLPATCTAVSLDGGKTMIAKYSAFGSNSCVGVIAVKAEGCRRGFDPDRFLENDIVCAVTNPPPPVFLEQK